VNPDHPLGSRRDLGPFGRGLAGHPRDPSLAAEERQRVALAASDVGVDEDVLELLGPGQAQGMEAVPGPAAAQPERVAQRGRVEQGGGGAVRRGQPGGRRVADC